MGLSLKKKLFISIAILFALFVCFSIFIEQYKERSIKIEALKDKLSVYTNILNNTIQTRNDTLSVHTLLNLFPSDLRVSIIDNTGKVLYDNSINYTKADNHFNRIEIKKAQENGEGSDVRTSTSTDSKYLYFAKKYDNYFIRAALPYDANTIQLLKSDNFFLYISGILFVVVLLIIYRMSNRLSRFMTELVSIATSDFKDIATYSHRDDELRRIGNKLLIHFEKLNKSNKQIQIEKEKLLQHIQYSQEGICFFSKNGEVEFYNGLFIQYINIIFDGENINPEFIIQKGCINGLSEFLDTDHSTSDFFETQISIHGRIFTLRASVFIDENYEIIINDITKQEKNRILKHEMTGNIAHELRTPITSIRGYIDTILSQDLTKDKQVYFLEKAQKQTILLSELISDMSLLTKIDDNPSGFNMEIVSLDRVLSDLVQERKAILNEKQIEVSWELPPNFKMSGNKNLIYSIFSNLIDNAVRYGGEKILIKLILYSQDESFNYFSFYDTGFGISDPNHLNRLFDRFYRTSEGRTRDTGGSGLGLAIVKNAILFHKGTIVAKQHYGGGLEFLFKLKK